MTKKTKKPLVLLLCLIALLGAGWAYQVVFSNKITEKPQTPTIDQQQKATIIVNDSASVVAEQISFSESTTAFALLQKMAEKNNWQIKTTDYGEMGLLIEEINAVKNGTDNKYWMYYINSQQPPVSASKQPVKNNDIIEFKFEKYNF